jgi:hypothetical protein
MQQDAVKQAARANARNGTTPKKVDSERTPDQLTHDLWVKRIGAWNRNGRVNWPKGLGPPPGCEGCEVPSDIVEQFKVW